MYPKRALCPIRVRGQVEKSPGRPLGFRRIGPPKMPSKGKGRKRSEKGKGRPGNPETSKRDRESDGLSTPSFKIVVRKREDQPERR